ncbi:hypothetical protein GC584_06370 [Corynebacterium sp. zg912]|uniref:FAD-binding FR-type domain-containing protein n=1 Tax=Corynebacterium wankanglinii TaxID=2735136 RepID=A0A7V8UV13_9CORY|nr:MULTISPECIES: hypothetical protein [Corynebacterium]MBA1837851.1 hypothetical protein [Corynebacterium wankanglinii]MCR5929044.1 hypothetical protein [Corynebacterium sp. zg912]
MSSADYTALIRTRGPEISEAWRGRFTEAYPQAEMMLPPGDEMPPMLIRAALSVLEYSPAEVSDRLKALASDLRRTGFPADEYPKAVHLLIDAISSVSSFVADDHADARADLAALSEAAEIMRETASTLDYEGVPAATAAQVTSMEDHGEVQVVRLEAGSQVRYCPGQVIPVMSPSRPGEWISLVPALPSNAFGQLEFHVPGRVPVAPGQWLTLGAPRGGVRGDLDGPLLLIAADGGFAAAKALLFHYLEQEQPPEVHAVIGAVEPSELYDTAALDALAATQDWLELTQVVESRVGATLEQVVSGAGMWWGRAVIICASQKRAASIAASLHAAGADNVQVVAYDAPAGWF